MARNLFFMAFPILEIRFVFLSRLMFWSIEQNFPMMFFRKDFGHAAIHVFPTLIKAYIESTSLIWNGVHVN